MRNISSILGRLAKSISTSLVLVFAIATSVQAQDVKEGETLFKSNCTTCHQVGRKVTGPALAGMSERHSEEWLIKWIKNSKAMIDSGDPAAVAIYEEYNKLAMTAFTHLSDDQIKSIIAYVKVEEVKIAEKKQQEGAAGGAAANTEKSIWTILGLAGLFVLVVIVIFLLNRVIRTLETVVENNKAAIQAAEERNQTIKENKIANFLKSFRQNKKLVGFSVLMIVAILGVAGWKTLAGVGINEGYKPVQPIKFSHQIHAGVNQIDCQYCHGGAYKSKNASIPSANVCMNCHNTITASEHYDGEISPEIAKIYRALDYNPDTREYGNNTRPIQWIRIHNLPDFAYFNHSQHVVVAGVECQTCHGPVENMEEVYHYSPLTMKWCIDCHRQTEVNTDNAYYDQLIEAHEKLKNGEKLTAAMIGGLECGKCHY